MTSYGAGRDGIGGGYTSTGSSWLPSGGSSAGAHGHHDSSAVVKWGEGKYVGFGELGSYVDVDGVGDHYTCDSCGVHSVSALRQSPLNYICVLEEPEAPSSCQCECSFALLCFHRIFK
jgi:hypothetical protein